MLKRLKGFTLIELVLTLALVSVLFSIGIYSYRSILSRNEKQVIIDRVKLAIEYAKTQAMNTGKVLYLTPVCDNGNWSLGMKLIYKNSRVSAEELIYQWDFRYRQWILKWSGIGHLNVIQFSPNPVKAISNGHFSLYNIHTKEKILLILNRLGRVKIVDRNEG